MSNPKDRGQRRCHALDWELAIAPSLDHATWLGMGPGEAYPDSRSAVRFGRYTSTVDDLATPYVFPQENGNRADCVWVHFGNGAGLGLLAAGHPMIDFSAHRYTTMDLENARHTTDLPRRDAITLHLDHHHNGLGTNSCGPGVLEKYELHPGIFDFGVTFRITPTPP